LEEVFGRLLYVSKSQLQARPAEGVVPAILSRLPAKADHDPSHLANAIPVSQRMLFVQYSTKCRERVRATLPTVIWSKTSVAPILAMPFLIAAASQVTILWVDCLSLGM
jgi:hypothetical protein